MIAVLGGLASACCWAMTGLLAQRASRLIGGLGAFAWAAVFGLILIAVPAIVALASMAIPAKTLVELALAGTLNVLGLVAQFAALRHGRISMVVPISSAEGAAAALVAGIGGAHIGLVGLAALATVSTGIGVSAVAGRNRASDGSGDARRDIALAVFSALAFGTGLYFQGHAGSHVAVALAIAPPSALGVALVAVPLASVRRLPNPRRALVVLPAIAGAELFGFVFYIVGSRHSLPTAAVLSSQYATVSIILSIVFLGERPNRSQILGCALIIIGVAAICAHQ